MRGKESKLRVGGFCAGITPACAGKSHGLPTAAQGGWDHPRMCGEKGNAARRCSSASGSPPRVRGKVKVVQGKNGMFRITPACAGKRLQRCLQFWSTRDHPRVCGEKLRSAMSALLVMGSPPRVRGKDSVCNESAPLVGITPAYAGKSLSVPTHGSRPGDHPRVCGEKLPIQPLIGLLVGSPPRVRGKGGFGFPVGLSLGITPACAGKSVRRENSSS